MNVLSTSLEGVYIIEPQVLGDRRGWFYESYSRIKLPDITTVDFVQDNHSYSKEQGVLRGIHFQLYPKSQAKLVRCIRGAVRDLAIDLKKDSPTYKKWIMVELSENNKRMIFIPKGFGHAFLTLTTDVEFLYKADEYYSPQHDRSILWNDPELDIDWGIGAPILSEKDKTAPKLSESDINY